MVLLVKLNQEELSSWGIIELQGDLESRSMSDMSSQFVGDLHFTNQSNGTPILIIGHHILYGKCVKMEKPFAVLRKIVNQEGSNFNLEYTVTCIVSHKLVFKTRPKPIIANLS